MFSNEYILNTTGKSLMELDSDIRNGKATASEAFIRTMAITDGHYTGQRYDDILMVIRICDVVVRCFEAEGLTAQQASNDLFAYALESMEYYTPYGLLLHIRDRYKDDMETNGLGEEWEEIFEDE